MGTISGFYRPFPLYLSHLLIFPISGHKNGDTIYFGFIRFVKKIVVFIPLGSPYDITYGVYSYLATQTFSLLNPILLEGIKGIISDLWFLSDISPIHINADKFVATSDAILAKSNKAFGNLWRKIIIFVIFRGLRRGQ